ncbi:hypothetical protein EV174_004655 [Coemansia sp. RSA 2320]|nr:hypothetical protein EV174_004655 [Coemansia sp. RSA 2320]
MVDIIDGSEHSVEAFVVEVGKVDGDYEKQYDIDLRGALIRLSSLEPPSTISDEASFRVCLRPRNGGGPSLEKNQWVTRLGAVAAESGEMRLVPLCAIDGAELKVQAFAQLRRS